MNLLITGISFIAFYFTLYYVVERNRVYRKHISSHDDIPKHYLAGIFTQSKEEFIISIGWIFLVVGVFLCLSGVLLKTI